MNYSIRTKAPDFNLIHDRTKRRSIFRRLRQVIAISIPHQLLGHQGSGAGSPCPFYIRHRPNLTSRLLSFLCRNSITLKRCIFLLLFLACTRLWSGTVKVSNQANGSSSCKAQHTWVPLGRKERLRSLYIE
jgi:hypothetical protein